MDEPGFRIEDANIAMIGLGLMGGSLALSLKDHCRKLSALDIDQRTLDRAVRMRIVHAAGSDPVEILADAGLVILACPVPEIINWLQRLPEFIRHACIVLDIGSSKRAIVSAMENLPERFDPLGGHAICGKERLSLENAERSIFQDASFVLTPLARTGAPARSAALQVIRLIGAQPVWMDAETHDCALAASSHLPFLIASALSLSMPEEQSSALVGSGFRSTARLAGTPSSMMLGVLETNRDNVLAELGIFKTQLNKLENALRKNDKTQLESTLDLAQNRYLTMIQ